MAKKASQLAEIMRSEERDLERIRDIELALHERAAEIVGDAMLAPEVARDAEEPPPHWYNTMTRERAARALAVAKAAWESGKEAPVFLKLAPAFLVGSMKARAQEHQGPRVLNATIVTTTAPLPIFPERVIHDDDDKI